MDDKTGYGLIQAGKTLRYVDPDSTLIWRLTNNNGPGGGDGGRYIASALTANFNFNGIVNGIQSAQRVEIRLDLDFPFEPGEDWQIWCYGEGPGGLKTSGWMPAEFPETIFTRGFCEIVPGSETENGVTVRTYVYIIDGTWYPTYWSWVDFTYGFLSVNFAPPAPQNLTQTASSGNPHLVWDEVDVRDLQGYHVYRSTNSNFSPNTKLTSSPIVTTEYDDLSVSIGGNQKKYYRVKAIDNSSHFSGWSNQVNVNGRWLAKPALASDESQLPVEYALEQNFPNPFNPETRINFALPENGYTRLIVYDLSGKEVTRLIESHLNKGYHHVKWLAHDVSSGIYFYRITSGNFTDMKKMVLLK